MPNAKESVAISSVFASAGLTGAKLVVGLLTGSMGILSEAMHSLLDLAAAVMTYFAVKHGDKPADEDHPFGHAKIESVSALIETGLLFITSVWIVYEAVRRLWSGNAEIEATWYAFAVIVGSIAVDVSRSRALSAVAKRTKSQALEADALHFSSDIWSSAVVLVGLALVRFGLDGADAVAAIGVALFVAVAGYRLGKRTIDVLVDAAPHGIPEQARTVAAAVEGVVRVERVRVRPLGASFHIELSVQVNRNYPLAKAQDIVSRVEAAIERHIPGSDAVIRAASVQLDSETIIEAVQALAARQDMAVHDVIVDDLDGRQFVSYDLEVADTLTVGEAHAIADGFEQAVKREVGGDIEINSHIDPMKKETVLSSNVTAAELERITAVVNAVDREIADISEPHDLLVRKIGDKFFVSFHCLAPADEPMELIHGAAARFEFLMKDRLPSIKRVVVHVEPKE